jgi:2-oxoisovalerate dehydrogenase E1 component alpha subunit
MTKVKSKLPLAKAKLLEIHDVMVKSRVLEERLIKIYKSGEAYFWIGGPGEEAFGVPLGLLAKRGQGHEHDYMHLHYRCSPTVVAYGLEMKDAIRQMMNKKTDPFTGGRNFSNHYAIPEWNIPPVTSTIETQYLTAIGTAHAQKRSGAKGITIATGGDAGTAEGDFASALVWASRKGHELPLLMIVTNNRWGISTEFEGQHGEKHIADRGTAFNIKNKVINGNDPVESYIELEKAIDYVRKNKKPFLLEASVSRLFGHSSADGANFRSAESDCLLEFEEQLKSWGLITDQEAKDLRDNYEKEARLAMEEARQEDDPDAESVWDHVYANNENADWRNF